MPGLGATLAQRWGERQVVGLGRAEKVPWGSRLEILCSCSHAHSQPPLPAPSPELCAQKGPAPCFTGFRDWGASGTQTPLGRPLQAPAYSTQEPLFPRSAYDSGFRVEQSCECIKGQLGLLKVQSSDESSPSRQISSSPIVYAAFFS